MSKQQIQSLVSKYLPEHQTQAQQLFAALEVNNSLPNAVVYGVYNSGKSSLLNSLTGHVEAEYFATRDIPETRITKQLEHQGLCYIDTPGLDVNEQDTATANTGAFQADIILFVHKLSVGPIQQADLTAMQNLAKKHGDTSHIIMVLTEAEIADENKSLIANITQQVQQAISPKIKPYLVSNPLFKKGITSGRQILIHKSGIPELLQDLQELAKKLSQTLQKTRQQKIASYKAGLLEKVEFQKEALEARKELNEAQQEWHVSKFYSAVGRLQLTLIQQNLHSMLETVKNL